MIGQIRSKQPGYSLIILLFATIGISAWAADPASVPLTPRGARLEAQYQQTMSDLRECILSALPAGEPEAMASYLRACQAEKLAEEDLQAAESAVQEIATAKALVAHARNKWIGGAEKGIQEAREMLEAASTGTERTQAQEELEKWQANKADGEAALAKRQAALDRLLIEEPARLKALARADEKLTKAQTATFDTLCKTGQGSFLPAGSVSAYLKACENEEVLEGELEVAQQALGKIGHARGLVGHAKNKWIAGAEKDIQKAEEMLKRASTEPERAEARAELARCQANRASGVAALAERQAVLDEILDEEPSLLRKVEEATQALAVARSDTHTAVRKLGVSPLLQSDALDEQLAQYVILLEATPRRLAEFAQQGEREEQLVTDLLKDRGLMMTMLLADGAARGNYGQAMEIYADIVKVSKWAEEGVLRRLALAISLEHAFPLRQDNAETAIGAPTYVDPVKRYLAYEAAFNAGELDPAFEHLGVWDLRMVVYGSEPDETLVWGRKMLRDYRPDHIANPDYRWRYVAIVRTDVPYTFGYEANDKPEYQFFQNILMNGGVCGRRAFFGRFILRAFGIPNTARPQPGHAALAHWTPDGWVLCFGAGWGSGWTRTRYEKDVDFLAATQIREGKAAFMQVKRAQWFGDVFGENRVFGLHGGTPGFWYGVSLYTQRGLIEASKARALAAVGEELGEANDSDVAYDDVVADVKKRDRQVSVDKHGVMTVPAVSCSSPTQSTRKILFMPSDIGGMQLHYNRVGGNPEAFEYTLNVPAAGTYKLGARIVTPTPDQHLCLALNGADGTVDIALPYTVGTWGVTDPVEIKLAKGKNVLTFSRSGEDVRGLTIKEFILTPVNNSEG